MKTTKKVLSVLLALLMLTLTVPVAFAEGGTDDGIAWDYNAGTKTLTISPAGSGANSGVMNDYYYYTYQLPPWSGVSANIKTIIINSGVKYIGEYAFYDYENLVNVTIPSSVQSIGENAFRACSNLQRVDIKDFTAWFNIQFSNIDSNPLTLHNASSLYLNGTKMINPTIPADATSIGNYALAGLHCFANEDTLTIPDRITSIGDYAFYGSTFFKHVKIPAGLTSIREGVFAFCEQLKSIIIPTSVTSIGESAFSRSGLENIEIQNGVTSIGDNAFWGCEALESLTIPDGVTSIGAYAFGLCDMLTEIRIPASVKSIGEGAFWTNASSMDVYITDLAAWCTIDFEDAWANPLASSKYTKLYLNETLVTVLSIPDSVNSIGKFAFTKCSSVKSVRIGNGVKSIGEEAFYDCDSLSCVTFGTNVESIASKAFADCWRLLAVVYGEINYPGSEAKWNAITIAEDAFDGYPENMTINYNYNGISSGTDGNINWTYNSFTRELTVSGTGVITTPWWLAYAGEIKIATVGGNITSIGSGAFGSFFTALETVTLSEGVTSIGESAFAFCDALQTISIPSSMTNIADTAFLDCKKLETINYAGSKTQWNEIHFGNNVFTTVETGELNAPYKVAVLLPGFVNLPFGTDGLKDKDWYFDFPAYVAYMVETFNMTESYPGEAEEFFKEAMALTTLQFNPATEAIMYTTTNTDGSAEVSEMDKADADGYNAYRAFIKQYTAPTQPDNPNQPGQPDNPGNGGDNGSQPQGKVCKYCGEVHTGFLGFFIGLFHSILALFGLRK